MSPNSQSINQFSVKPSYKIDNYIINAMIANEAPNAKHKYSSQYSITNHTVDNAKV